MLMRLPLNEGGAVMKAAHSEPSEIDPSCEIRLGTASWDDGKGAAKSIKYTWFDKLGRACRGGEFPIEALPQAIDFAIRNGYLKLSAGDVRGASTGGAS
jgi:hypothetical protein